MRELEYPSYNSAPVADMSWGSVIAGVFVTVASMAALGMLGAGIGLASAPAAHSGAGLAKGLGVGAGVWLLVSGVIAYFAGGWVTGRMNRTGVVSESVVHSVVTWAVATTAFTFLVTSAIGGLVGGAANLIGAGANAAGAGGAAYAGRASGPPDQLADQAKAQGNKLKRQVEANAPSREQVEQTAETAAKAAGATGIAGFFMIALEALACAAGGRSGTRSFRPRSVSTHRMRETTPSA